MDFKDLMEWKGYIYLNQLFEPEETSLQILIDRCKVSNEREDLNLGDNILIDSYSIDVDEDSPIIQMDFESYVAYSVINESFTIMDEYEESQGELFRIFTKSRYLDFVKLGTIAEAIFPDEKFLHFQIPCLNHIIDVISFENPTISEVTRS